MSNNRRIKNNQYFNSKTVVVIQPPKEEWEQFIDIKKNHMNNRIKRPPYPHITLFKRFYHYTHKDFDAKIELLKEVMGNIEPFEVSFNEFKIFHGNNRTRTLYLEPEVNPPDSLDNLYNELKLAFPECVDDKEMVFHLGIGFFKSPKEAEDCQNKYQSVWNPVIFDVNEIYVNYRTTDYTPFIPRLSIFFRDITESSTTLYDFDHDFFDGEEYDISSFTNNNNNNNNRNRNRGNDNNNNRIKTKKCSFFQRGKCKFGNDCKFLHE
eukprot:TRINITY_DN4631_c0_g1_i1.p1 TRINITY_DN4631_c0_g1~~TRINITY_DN4631_c0_g1_i1.p1  ORF type:complete len:287 (-),score=60.36 TRINITY_DN4631_c0_g1_i1:8-802(-)